MAQFKQYGNSKDSDLIAKAYKFAEKAHHEQKRKSGEPYIIHPLNVACTLAHMKIDAKTIAASLLHDVIEDTPINEQQLEKEFGSDILFLVNGVSKLEQVRVRKNAINVDIEETKPDSFHSLPRQFQTLQKMFVAMAKDIRVIIIKLADRLHNMETLQHIDSTEQLRIAQETLEIYAPIADRLGIGELKGKLEDLAFPYIFPKDYLNLKTVVEEKYPSRLKYVQRVKKVLEEELKKNHIKGQINGRAKHLYSLYNKLKRYNDIDQIYDLVALRIIVSNISDCYAVLGIIHKLWKPLNGRIKDYIALPKPNGYQSIHTTVFCLDGVPTELQIRTEDMHYQAEYGIAAHWQYKKQRFGLFKTKRPIRPSAQEIAWIQQLADWQQKLSDTNEWNEIMNMDFFQNRIFVFTPKGDVHDLPFGSTPVDFAFAVHSDIGSHCAGAKVNGKMVTISHPLQNGDIIEIITSKKSSPKTDWLTFIKTASARSYIKQAIKEKTPRLQKEK